MMNIIEALRIKEKEVISFVGGGGKTTSIRLVSKHLKSQGKKALITTTTHMYPEGSVIVDNDEDRLYKVIEGIPDEAFPIMCGREINDEIKMCGVTKDFVDRLYMLGKFPHILIEADGAKGRPIKAFGAYEPVVPQCTTKYVIVIGLDCIGKPLDETYAHRPHIVSSITGEPLGSVIDDNLIVKLFTEKEGLLKGSTPLCSNIVLLNKADDLELYNKGLSLGKRILQESSEIDYVIICCGQNEGKILELMER